MKKIALFLLVMGWTGGISAQEQNKDMIQDNTTTVVDKVYQKVLETLDGIQFTGNSEASREIQRRWNAALNSLLSNKGSMTQDVKNLLISPSGNPIDLELLQRLIKVTEKDSVKSYNINMDFLLDEMKAASSKITNAAKKVAETK